jgi:AraC family transcriptional regulator, regulatory protein of adaptative response / DNA-3-methyladenine glycosylase II
MIEGGALDDGDVAGLAERLAIGERQLRRLFAKHIGAAPVTVAQTRRVLLAKQLLHQTDLSMIEVALGSGFGSVRRFNETFQHLYGKPPSQIRRRAASSAPAPEIALLLPYHPPYDWEVMLGFLAGRAIRGVESVAGGSYSRVVELSGQAGSTGSITISHAPKQSALRAIVRFPRMDALPHIITRIRRMFDLSADPDAIGAALGADPALAPMIAARPGLRVPGAFDGFEVAVRAVLGQQITVRAATNLAARIVERLGTPVAETIPGLTHAFPRPEFFTAKSLANSGMPGARAAALAGIAAASIADPHLFDPRRDLAEAIADLKKLPGIGEWTAQYIAMRALGETDAFLAGDVGLQRILAINGTRPNAAELLQRAERWRPWRAYAVLHVWMAETPQSSNTKGTPDALAA